AGPARVFGAVELVAVLADRAGQPVADVARRRARVVVEVDGGHPRAVLALKEDHPRQAAAGRLGRDDGDRTRAAQVGAVAAAVGPAATPALADRLPVALVALHAASR